MLVSPVSFLTSTTKPVRNNRKNSQQNIKRNTNQNSVSTDFIDRSNVSFGKYLYSHLVDAVNALRPNEYMNIAKRMKSYFGITANFNKSNTVAWCAEQTAMIMKRAGFEIPKRFSFEKFDLKDEGVMGAYVKEDDTVYVNADYSEFLSLIDLNELENSTLGSHPGTRHFLQTYVHEFSHSAHYNNLRNLYGKRKATDLFEGYMSTHSPTDILLNPAYTVISYVPVLNAVCSFFPPEHGVYGKTNLKEYFAVINTEGLLRHLRDSYDLQNIDYNFCAKRYKVHPKGWFVKDKLIESTKIYLNPLSGKFDPLEAYDKALEITLQNGFYTNGDIFHGKTNLLEERSLIEKNEYYFQ